MKIPGLFKLLNLIAPLFILNLSVFGQNSFLKPDSKKDSAWVQQSLLNANRELITNKDTNRVIHTWVSGKVLYCSDGTLKAAQLIAAPDTFSATIQYCNHNKIFEQHFDYTDLSNYTLNSIYRLPDKAPSYLFLLSKTENQPDYEPDWLKDFNRISGSPNDMDVKHIKRLTYVAVVLRLVKDSLVEAAFPSYKTANDDNQVADSTDPADSIYTANNKAPADTSSFSFTSYIKPAGKWPKPFLKYDTLTHILSFLNVYCKQDDDNNNCTQPALNVESGTYQYKDTSFMLSKDSSYYYPSLPELDKVIARRNYKAGKYIIKAEAIEGYEEEYGGAIQQTLTKKYRIEKQILTSFNNEAWDKVDLKPNYRLQNNSSVILLLEDETNGYAPGACGSGSHFDSYFYLIDGKSKKMLFSFSTSTCTANVDYTFKQNGKEIADRLYLIDPANEFNTEYEFDGSYWKNDSTYVFVVSDSEKSLSRNFYLHFNVADKKNPVKLMAGKLYEKNQHQNKQRFVTLKK